jgi:hypothetical protein
MGHSLSESTSHTVLFDAPFIIYGTAEEVTLTLALLKFPHTRISGT